MSINLDAVTIVHQKGRKDFCSGALISQRLVLTALHCVQAIGAPGPPPASSFRVGFGPSTRADDMEWKEVSKILIPAESYTEMVEDLRGRDIALLVLASVVNTTPFPIPKQTPLPQAGTELVIVGFGEDRYGYVGRRHTTRVQVTGRTETGFAFMGGGCLGDSGGPILDRKDQFVGLVSLGTSKHCVPTKVRFGQPLAPFSDFIIDQLLRRGQNN